MEQQERQLTQAELLLLQVEQFTQKDIPLQVAKQQLHLRI